MLSEQLGNYLATDRDGSKLSLITAFTWIKDLNIKKIKIVDVFLGPQ